MGVRGHPDGSARSDHCGRGQLGRGRGEPVEHAEVARVRLVRPLNLATKRATGTQARRHREVRVYEVAAGLSVELAAAQAMGAAPPPARAHEDSGGVDLKEPKPTRRTSASVLETVSSSASSRCSS